MNREELYELLDIDSPEDFQYFENLAAYLECDDQLEYEDIAALIKDIDKDTLAQLVDNYFEEISDFIPAAETAVYGILENVRRALIGMIRNCNDETMETKLVDEFERFRCWYSMDSQVFITDMGTVDEKQFTLRDALVNARIEKLDGDKYQYDFSQCEDYPLEEYIVSFGDMVAIGEAEDEADESEQ